MRAFTVKMLFTVAVLCCTFAVGQQAAKPEVSQLSQSMEKSQASAQHAPAPPAELQSLIKALSGRWSLAVKFEPSEGAPLVGEETWRSGAGGFTLIEDERLPTPQGDVFLLGLIWWDNRSKSLQGMECNSQLPFTCDLKGGLNDITLSWDGKQFAISEWETHGGKKTLWHEVWSDITATSFTQTGESEEPDGSRKRFFTIHGTRTDDAGN